MAATRSKAVIWIRWAAILVLVHGVLHTIGGVFGGAESGLQAATLAAMKGNQFKVYGVTRTYWDFYKGSGLVISVNFFLQAFLLWQMGTMAAGNGRGLRALVAAFAVGYLVFAVLSWRYFFAGPVSFEVLIAGCLMAAYVRLGQAEDS